MLYLQEGSGGGREEKGVRGEEGRWRKGRNKAQSFNPITVKYLKTCLSNLLKTVRQPINDCLSVSSP